MKSFEARGEDPAISIALEFLDAFIGGDRLRMIERARPTIAWFGRNVALGKGGGQTPKGPWSTAEVGALRTVPAMLLTELDPAVTDGKLAVGEALVLADLRMGESVVTVALIVDGEQVRAVFEPDRLKAELVRVGQGDG
jgi:hypothetical protein